MIFWFCLLVAIQSLWLVLRVDSYIIKWWSCSKLKIILYEPLLQKQWKKSMLRYVVHTIYKICSSTNIINNFRTIHIYIPDQNGRVRGLNKCILFYIQAIYFCCIWYDYNFNDKLGALYGAITFLRRPLKELQYLNDQKGNSFPSAGWSLQLFQVLVRISLYYHGLVGV